MALFPILFYEICGLGLLGYYHIKNQLLVLLASRNSEIFRWKTDLPVRATHADRRRKTEDRGRKTGGVPFESLRVRSEMGDGRREFDPLPPSPFQGEGSSFPSPIKI